MPTVGEFARNALQRISEGRVGNVDQLDVAINATVSTVTLRHGVHRVAPGMVLEVGDGEQLYVWAYTAATRTATVERGWNDTTPAAAAAGTLVRVAPRFFVKDVIEDLVDEVQSWPTFIGRVVELNVTVADGAAAGDLGVPPGSEVRAILEVKAVGSRWQRHDAQLLRDSDVATFPSGWGIQFPELIIGTGTVVQVQALVGFDLSDLSAGVDLATTVGLPPSLLDALRFGVAWRMLAFREVNRTETVSRTESSVPERVPPTHLLQTTQALKAMRDTRLAEEETRIMARWPLLRSWQ